MADQATTDFAGARREVLTSMPMYWNMIQQMAAPFQADFSRMGASQGSAMAQDFRAALGRLGASGTGVGGVAQVLGNTLVSSTAAAQRMKLFELIMNNTMQLQGGALAAGGPGAKRPGFGESLLTNFLGSAGAIASPWLQKKV